MVRARRRGHVATGVDADEPADHARGRSRGGFGINLQLLCDGTSVPLSALRLPGDDVDVARLVRPAIATCHVPREQLGQESVRLLLARTQQPSAPTRAVVLDTTFIARDSIRRLE